MADQAKEPGGGPVTGRPEGADGGPGPAPRVAALRLAAYFLRYLRPLRGLVVLMVGSLLVTSVISLPMTFLPKVLTERFEDASYLQWYFAFVLGTLVAGWVLGVLQSYWSASLGEALMRAMRRDVFSNLERLSMLAVYAKGPSQFVQHVSRDVVAVRQLIGHTLFYAGLDVARGVAVLVAMLALEPIVTLVVVGGFVAGWGLVRLTNRRVEHYAGIARDQSQEITGQLVENVGGFRDIQAAGRFSQFAANFDTLLKSNQRTNVRTAVWGQTSGLVPAIMISLAIMGVYWLGWRQAADVREVGALVTYAALLGQLFPALLSVTRATTEFAMSVPSMRALREILDRPEPAGRADAVALQGPIESIRFDHVTLELEGRRILDDLTFDIPPGKMTAIIGQSGSGKTTLFHLMLRLLEPTHGAILINGVPLERVSLESLRSLIGFIPQNPFIFNQSLRDNIFLAAPTDPSPDELAHAIEIAQLEEVVALRHDQGGLNAAAGYMGSRLSAGEKQRIALARLVLRDPQVIICDEYTANVDVQTARLIHAAMRTRFAGRTRVVITHEIYTVRGADHVVVIDHGQVVQLGTHEQLCGQPGLYRQLLEVQSV